ncbi:TPA: hypothetical protein ACWWCX_001785 [Enterococcus faecium]
MEKVWLWKSMPSIGFLCVSLVYLNGLKKLNKVLTERLSGEDSLSLLGYNNGQPVKYFIIAFLLILVSLGLGYLYLKWIRFDAYHVIEVIMPVIYLILLIWLDVSIIENIAIPIFQAILSVCVTGGVIVWIRTSN